MKWLKKLALVAFVIGALFVGITIRSTFEAGNYYQTAMISLSAVVAVLTIRYSGRLINKEDDKKCLKK